MPIRKKDGFSTAEWKQRKKIYLPQDKSLELWNRLFVICCFLSVSWDPLMLYAPYIDGQKNCVDMDMKVAITTTLIRTLLDAFYAIRIFFESRTSFFYRSSRVIGRRELVMDSAQVSKHYFKGRLFIIDLLSILPLPQIAIWRYLVPDGAGIQETETALVIIVLLQYIPRFIRIHHLASEVNRTVGVFVQSSYCLAVGYLVLLVLFSHTVGSFWYILGVQRNVHCWDNACKASSGLCRKAYLYCTNYKVKPFPISWKNINGAFFNRSCSGENDDTISDSVFRFGIYKEALESGLFLDNKFVSKYFNCLWWGLRNLSTIGQGLEPSMDPGEIAFTILMAVFGIILFGLLIGHMQTLLLSLSLKMDEMRTKRHESEEWMNFRAVPEHLRERIRHYDQYKWVEERGVDEEDMIQTLPNDLKRDIKRHLRLSSVRRIPLFSDMDERLLKAICLRLKQNFYIEKSCVIREGDPVDEVVFIMHGMLQSESTDGGWSGFYNQSVLREGDFCGDELLSWSLDPRTGSVLPLSTRTVQTLTEVQAFALSWEDMKFVASQLSVVQCGRVQCIFCYYSLYSRTWAARFIQSAWRRYTRKKIAVAQRPSR